MGLTPEGFLRRLHAGKVVNCNYRKDGLVGLLSSWRYEGRYILTWEECREGDVNNEQLYTRDERHELATPEEVLAFVERNGYPASSFTP